MTIDNCKPGDKILIDLPCVVEIVSIEEQPGHYRLGDRKVTYTNAQVFVPHDDFIDIGSKVNVTRVR